MEKKKLKFTQNAMIKQAMSICHDLSMVGFIGIFKTILQAKKKKKIFLLQLLQDFITFKHTSSWIHTHRGKQQTEK